MNFGELVTAIHEELQLQPQFTTARLYKAANKAIREMTKFTMFQQDFWQMVAQLGTDGLYLYEYVMDMVPIAVMSATYDGSPMRQLALDEWQNLEVTNDTDTGDPSVFIVRHDGQNVVLDVWPRPKDAKIMRVVSTELPTEISDTAYASKLLDIAEESLVIYGTYFCLRSQPGEEKRAEMYLNLYKEQKGDDKNTINHNRVIKTRRV